MRCGFVIALLVMVGCGKPSPTYDEALQTYKAEVELLQTLESQMAIELAPLLAEQSRIINERVDTEAKIAKLNPRFVSDSLKERHIAIKQAWAKQESENDSAAKAVFDKYSTRIKEQRAKVAAALKIKDEAEKRR